MLELSENDENIVNRIRRAIPLSVLSSNLVSTYKVYKNDYKDYNDKLFNRA